MKKLNVSKKYIIAGGLGVIILIGAIFIGNKAAAWNKAKTNSIGLENAQNFALADSGIDPKSAQILKTTFDHEDGEFIYEVKFIYENVKYEYDIKASDGTVLKKSLENINNTKDKTTISPNINAESARDIALKDLGFNVEEVSIVKMNLDLDDGNPVYEVKFIANNKEYEYEINAVNGVIVAKDIKTLNSGNTNNNGNQNSNTNNNQNSNISNNQGDNNLNTNNNSNNSSEITLDEAKKIALKDAKLSTATFTKTKTDYENGIKVYDLEFHYNNTEYEYEIKTSDGSIYSKKSEAYNNGNTNNGTKEITLDEAKKIALKDAKLSTATFMKTQTDYENGVKVYDLEFHYNNTEYEYEIKTSDGSIYSKKSEVYNNGNTNNGTKEITLDEAKKIALKDAKLSTATFTKTKTDYDDGIKLYEIEFYHNGLEYEYEINAMTGAILSKDIDRD